MAAYITGKTRPFLIVADPVHHLRTPQAFNQAMADASFDGVLIPAHVQAPGLATFIKGVRQMHNLAGLIITVPHKIAVLPLCDELSPRAQMVGSVNTIRVENGRLIGDNFDGLGFVKGLLSQGYDVQGRAALLLGGGGAARAIGFALADAGVSRLIIANRDVAKARDLAAAIASAYRIDVKVDGDHGVDNFDLIANATSLGLNADDALPILAERIKPHHMVAEVVMMPEMTKLLATARDRGAGIHLGKHMLDAQLVEIGRFLSAF